MFFEYYKMFYWAAIPSYILILYYQYKNSEHNDYCITSSNKLNNTVLISTLFLGLVLIGYLSFFTVGCGWIIILILWIMSIAIVNYWYIYTYNILE